MTTEVRGRIVCPDKIIDDGVVCVVDDRIAEVLSFDEWRAAHTERPVPESSGLILPGLVDIHCHGGGGHAFTTTDVAEARGAAAHHHAHGTTTMLASLVTAPAAVLVDQVAALTGLVSDGTLGGIHAEGPFLSGARCGAQDPRYLIPPDIGLTRKLIEASGGSLRMMTVAPELDGSKDVVAALTEAGVTVAVGHSDASYSDFRAALADPSGASVVTHLANGMPPVHHRDAGPVAAALVASAAGEAFVELIADGVHIDSGFAALVFATAPERVALITDAMAAAGMPDGTYQLGPQQVSVVDGVARTSGGAIAGGTSVLIDIVRRCVVESKVSLVQAVRAASLTPAAAVGLDSVCGALRPGLFADVIVADDELRVRRVLRRGQWIC